MHRETKGMTILASFLILAIHDAGKKYMELTRQSETIKHAFGMVVNPLMAFIILASLFYVLIGGTSWFFIGLAIFIGLILFVVDAVPFFEHVKKP